jgi:3-hexulose-6-phosphate synthase/6-phospho-3-hexuloisomerase
MAAGDDGTMQRSLTYIFAKAQTTLEALPREVTGSFVDALAAARRVFVYGTGRSGLVARAFAVRLAHLGYSTYVIGETITAPVQAEDLVILVSGSGETYPVAMTSEIAQTIGARVVVITGNRHGRVAQGADVVVELEPPEGPGAERAGLAPLGTLFETTAWLLLDGVVADLMLRRNQTEEMMRQRHATLE